MNQNNCNKEKRIFQNIILKDCENVNLDMVLENIIENYNSLNCLKKIKASVLGIWTYLKYCGVQYDFREEGTCEALVVCCGNREDHNEAICYATSMLKNKILVCNESFNYDKKSIKHLKILLEWNKILKKEIFSPLKRWLYLSFVFYCYSSFSNIDHYISSMKTSPRFFICRAECIGIHIFLSQKYKAMGMNTVGVATNSFTRDYDKNFRKYGYEKILCYGQFAIDECEKCGMDSSFLLKVGIPKLIGESVMESPLYKTRSIALFVDFGNYKYNKIYKYEIDVLQSVCAQKNMKLYVKLHPLQCTRSQIKKFKSIIRRDLDVSFVSNDMGAVELIKLADIIIVHNSSVLVEGFAFYKPVFQFTTDDIKQKVGYDDVDLIRISSAEELQYQIDHLNTRKRLKKIRDYFIESGDTAENFRKIYDQMGIK